MPTLSEAASKELLGAFGVPFPPEHRVATEAAVGAADALGYPVVVKLGGDGIAHKTERGLVRLGLGSPDQVRDAAGDLLAAATPEDGEVHLLVAPMLRATRELIAGLHDDPQFGMTVMLGVGGILALLGPFRGEPAVDREAVARVLLGLSEAAAARADIASADLNPLLVVDGRPVAVDALVELR